MHAQFHKVGNRFLLRSSLLQCQPAHRIPVPERVSLVCMDADPTFAWCVPAISHIRWDSGSVVRRIVRWAATVNRDRNDVRQTLPPAKFVPDGTIAPAAAGSER